MDEIEERLKETSEQCIEAYKQWRKNENNDDIRERLHDTVHELRKVSSRLEIEMAISERNEMSKKPIPLPPHRAKKGGKQLSEADSDNGGDLFGEENSGSYFREGSSGGSSGGGAAVHVKRSRRRPSVSKDNGNSSEQNGTDQQG